MAADTEGPLLLLSDVHGHFPVIAAQIEHAARQLGRPVACAVVAGDLGLFEFGVMGGFHFGDEGWYEHILRVEMRFTY